MHVVGYIQEVHVCSVHFPICQVDFSFWLINQLMMQLDLMHGWQTVYNQMKQHSSQFYEGECMMVEMQPIPLIQKKDNYTWRLWRVVVKIILSHRKICYKLSKFRFFIPFLIKHIFGLYFDCCWPQSGSCGKRMLNTMNHFLEKRTNIGCVPIQNNFECSLKYQLFCYKYLSLDQSASNPVILQS